jgi:hypothetical protein
LFYYYSDYSIIYFPLLYIVSFPLYTSFIYFLLRERRGERERERERRRSRRGRRRKGTSLPLKTDLTLVIYKILKKTLVL